MRLRAFRSISICLLITIVIACSAPSDDEAEAEVRAAADSPETAAESSEATITAVNVYDYEAYWPNIVVLEESWLPPGQEKPLKAKYRGALVRVEADRRVRVDFGRHGKHDIPIERTDLVQRTVDVRAGRRHKTAPGFVLQMGTRLVDSSGEVPGALPSIVLDQAETFLCLFADPTAEDFPALARAASALDALDGVMLILFPQGLAGVDLATAHEKLRGASWQAPYAYPRLTPDHTRSLLGVDETPPYALVVTPEGRVLFRTALEDPRALAALHDAVSR